MVGFMTLQAEAAPELKTGKAGSLTEFATRPALKYVGFALLLAWHYALWFVPHMFSQTELLDERVTTSSYIVFATSRAVAALFTFLFKYGIKGE